MFGPSILSRYLAEPGPPDRHGYRWQYHSRSDRHSKVACWGVAFDLLRTSALLRDHVATGKVVMGLNHTMVDFTTSRRKDLDLVIARSTGVVEMQRPTFARLAESYPLPLTAPERAELEVLPELWRGPVGAVLVAVEAKACMTAHVKSLPRLYDELNSSHLCVHGASNQALAIGYIQVNAATEFVSPIVNARRSADVGPDVNRHRQPHDLQRVLGKVGEIPRRGGPAGTGFDGIGITVLDFTNDGGPVRLVENPPAPQPNDPFHYSSMVVRMATEYDTRFSAI